MCVVSVFVFVCVYVCKCVWLMLSVCFSVCACVRVCARWYLCSLFVALLWVRVCVFCLCVRVLVGVPCVVGVCARARLNERVNV